MRDVYEDRSMRLLWEAQYESIPAFEKVLRERVSDSHGSPFIAHCDVSSDLEKAAANELVAHIGGRLPTFLQLMSRFPYSCTRIVAMALAQFYGAKGNAAVYRPISKCLQVGNTVPQQHRRSLFSEFRRSCERIGLTLPPRKRIKRLVDIYLFQAGIPHSQLPVLAKAFLKAERLLGLPSIDDTRSLNEWEDWAVVEFSPRGHKVLQRIVTEDSTAYHAATFLRLRDRSDGASSRFEREFSKAIERASEPSHRGRKAVRFRPHLEYVDGELRIAIPKGAQRLETRIRDRIYPLSPDQPLTLPLPWPTTVEWRPGAGEDCWQQVSALVDFQGILVFDGETGLHKKTLDPTKPRGQHVWTGQFCLLSRTEFRVNGESCHPLGTDAFVLFYDISTKLSFEQGDLRFTVDVQARPRIEALGMRIVRNRDGWLLAGPISVRIVDQNDSSAQSLEVRVSHPAQDREHKFCVKITSIGELKADIDLPRTGNFGRAQVSLHIQGQHRALFRTAFWYWPGLNQLINERLFDATSIPANLAEKRISHIGRNDRGQLVLLEEEPYLRARLCFWVKGRLVSFSLPPPGASLSVRRADGVERPLELGTSLSVREGYASSLIVRCSDPKAEIDLKGEIIPAAFGQTGVWQISFAALKQEGTHNRVRLLSNREPNSPLDLVRVMREAEPSSLSVRQYDAAPLCVMASFHHPIDAVRIEAENLILRQKLGTEIELASPSGCSDNFPTVAVIPTASANQFRIEISRDEFGDGIWFVSFQIRDIGRTDWSPIIDSSGGACAACIVSDVYAQKLASEDISEWCPESLRAQAFLRLSQAIETPIAGPCRRFVLELAVDAWKRLGMVLDINDAGDRASLLNACTLPPSPHAHYTWVPVHHPVEVAPDLFAVPAEELGQLALGKLPGYAEFELVGLAGITQSLRDAVEALDISMTFIVGFKRASRVQSDPDASPGEFDFSAYCKSARTVEHMAEDDKPLSTWYHDRACERMADRVHIASKSDFFSGRLQKATAVVHHFKAHTVSEGLDIPHDLTGGFQVVQGTPSMIAALTRAWRDGDSEQFWDDLASKVNWPVAETRKHVGTILRLAPELLAFYLLLWVLVERHQTP